jgi:hypothetical protein
MFPVKLNPMKVSIEQRRRMTVRAYANTYKRRGWLVQTACEKCGDPDTQMHHVDYSRPLDVRWLCRPCHRGEHATVKPLWEVLKTLASCRRLLERTYKGGGHEGHCGRRIRYR